VLGQCAEQARILLTQVIAFVLFPVQEKVDRLRDDDTIFGCKNGNSGPPHEGKCEGQRGEGEEGLSWPLRKRMIVVRFLAKEMVGLLCNLLAEVANAMQI
jgi:hypothetical protein